jgi:hypothetical protein
LANLVPVFSSYLPPVVVIEGRDLEEMEFGIVPADEDRNVRLAKHSSRADEASASSHDDA